MESMPFPSTSSDLIELDLSLFFLWILVLFLPQISHERAVNVQLPVFLDAKALSSATETQTQWSLFRCLTLWFFLRRTSRPKQRT
jgi:hypothetical protein